MPDAVTIEKPSDLTRWRNTASLRGDPKAKRWASTTLDLVVVAKKLAEIPCVIARDGRVAPVALALVQPSLRATNVVAWRGDGTAIGSGVPLTKPEIGAVPPLAEWRSALPAALRLLVVRFADGAIVATTIGPRAAIPADGFWDVAYAHAHRGMK